MSRKLFVLVLGWGLWAAPLRAQEGGGIALHLSEEMLRRPRQTKESVGLGWWLEGGVLGKDQAYRVLYSPDAGKTWRTLHTGGEPSHIWSLHGEESTKDGILAVELIGPDGTVAARDEFSGIVIDDVQPEVSAEAAPLSKDREVLVHVKVKAAGPSGLALLQLWVTRDGGRRWEYAGSSRDPEKPFTFRGEKGRYGFSVTAVGGSRLVEPHPMPGDKPEAETEISPDEPVVQLEVGHVARFPKAGDTVSFSWNVMDDDLPESPAVAEYRTSDGRWVEIFRGGPAEGNHVWTLPAVSMAISELRVRARDVRGNTGEKAVRVPCWIDADAPTADILGPAVWDKEGDVEVQYRINESGSGIERAEMFYRIAPDGPWHPFSKLPPVGGTVQKMLQDGVYDLAIEAADRAGNRMPLASARPALLVVDRTPPAVAIDAVTATAEGVALQWTSSDPNLGGHPVQIFAQVEGDPRWHLLKGDLPHRGEWKGPLPEGVREGMGIALRVTSTDRSGKSASALAAIRVAGDVPTIRLTQVRFVEVLKLLMEWESSGKNLAAEPVDLRIVFWRGTEQEVLHERKGLPASGSLTVNVPKDLPGHEIYVEVGCRNEWGARHFQSATVELYKAAPQGEPAIRFTDVSLRGGKLAVAWEASGIDLGEKAVTIELAEEGGTSAVHRDLPPTGERALDVAAGRRSALRLKGTCVDNKGRRGEATVFVVLPASLDHPAAGLRIDQIMREGRRLTVSLRGADPGARIEYRRAGGEWTPVPAKPDDSGVLSWEIPADWTGTLELRAVSADGKTASGPESVSLDGTVPRPPHAGTGRRPSARAVWAPGTEPYGSRPEPPPAAFPDPLKPAREMLVSGRAEEAEQFLRVFLAKRPDSVEAHLLQIQALRFLGKRGPEVVDLYRRALAISPHDARILNDLGLYHLIEEGNARESLSYFEEALAAGHTPEAHFNVGRARFQMREYALAAAAFERALAVDPRFSDARYFLARIYTETPLADPAKAARLWDAVRAESSDDPERLGRAESELRRLR